MEGFIKVNTTWLLDAARHTDTQQFLHPPASQTGIDMTWVLDVRVTYLCFVCVVVSCAISFAEIKRHASRFDFPKIQIYVIRILFMIPFYGVLSFFSVVFHQLRFFIDTIRDTYEAFVLYTFFSLLIEYCGGERQLLRALHRKKYLGVHPWPLCCIPMYPLNTAFYLRCKRYVLQYALIKPLASLLTCIGALLGWYREADFTASNMYPYLFTINNMSISFSLYYLVLFHLETEKELAYCKPTWKFICIKSIIFFAFWQSATVGVCIALGWMYTGEDEHVQEQVNTAIQDVLMCFELVPVALMHHLAFSRDKLGNEMAAEPIYDNDGGRLAGTARKHLDEAMSLGDVVRDIVGTIFYREDRLFEDDEDDGGENGADATGDSADHGAIAESRGGRSQLAGPGAAGSGGGGGESGRRPTAARNLVEPTVDELLAFVVGNDRGVRVDGLRHFDPDEARDAANQRIDDDRAEEDECFARVGGTSGGAARDSDGTALVVTVGAGNVASGPSAFCVVCGRFDRQLVKRASGFKCQQCVGRHSNRLLSAKQRERHAEDNDGSCIVCGRTGRPMVRRGAGMKCIDCLKASK